VAWAANLPLDRPRDDEDILASIAVIGSTMRMNAGAVAIDYASLKFLSVRCLSPAVRSIHSGTAAPVIIGALATVGP